MAGRYIKGAKKYRVNDSSVRFYIQEMSDGNFYGEVQMGFDSSQSKWTHNSQLLEDTIMKTQSFDEEKSEQKVYYAITSWLCKVGLPQNAVIEEYT